MVGFVIGVEGIAVGINEFDGIFELYLERYLAIWLLYGVRELTPGSLGAVHVGGGVMSIKDIPCKLCFRGIC